MAKKKLNGTPMKKESKKAEAERKDINRLVDRIQDSMSALRDVLRESGGAFTEGNRELGLRALSHAQTNAEAGFAALRETLGAESVSDALRVQQEAVRDSLERNLGQARDVGSLINENRKSITEPVSNYLREVRSDRQSA